MADYDTDRQAVGREKAKKKIVVWETWCSLA